MIPTRDATARLLPIAVRLLIVLSVTAVRPALAADTIPHGEIRKVDAGVFLVASSQLTDPHFSKTVVLIIEHGLRGTTGVIVNRPTATPLSRVLPDVKELTERAEALFVGGPVARQVLTILVQADSSPPSSTPVFDRVYASHRIETLTHVLQATDPAIRFRLYSGYAGWAPGQLQHEIDLGGWRLIKGESAVVFDQSPDSVWPTLTRRLSEQFVRTERPEAYRPLILSLEPCSRNHDDQDCFPSPDDAAGFEALSTDSVFFSGVEGDAEAGDSLAGFDSAGAPSVLVLPFSE